MSTNSTTNSCPNPATQGWDAFFTVTQSVLASGVIDLYKNDRIPHTIKGYDVGCPTLTIDTTTADTINIKFPLSNNNSKGTVTLALDLTVIAIETIVELYYANLPGEASSYVDCGNLDTAFSSSDGFTFEAWVQKKGSDSQTLFSIGDKLSLSVEVVSEDSSNATKLTFTWGISYSQTDSYTDLSDGQWHHIAIIVDNQNNKETIYFYIDGRKLASYQLDDTQTASGGLMLGSSFNGYITQVAVWKVALSESDLQSWMNATLSSSTPGLVGYWTFDDGTSSKNIVSGQTINLDGTATIATIVHPDYANISSNASSNVDCGNLDTGHWQK